MKSETKQRNTRNETPGPKKAILVRLPINTAEYLSQRAEAEKRSVNAHVEYLIEQDLKAAA